MKSDEDCGKIRQEQEETGHAEGSISAEVAGYAFGSHVELRAAVLDYSRRSCKIPAEYDPMIVAMVTAQMSALSQALGNLELCFLRTKQHQW